MQTVSYPDRSVVTERAATCSRPVSRFVAIAAAAGRLDDAIAQFEAALETAQHWGAEPLVAAIRLELADLLERAGADADSERAGTLRSHGLQTARRPQRPGLLEFCQREAEKITCVALAPAAPAGAATPGSPHTRAVAFYRRGDIWRIGPPDDPIQLHHVKGLTHIVRLLGAPHVDFHALDLAGASSGDRGSPAVSVAGVGVESGIEVRARGSGDAGPVLDAQAKAAYRVRLTELQEAIEEAESFNDPERAARAHDELGFVTRELASAIGLDGRDRKMGSDAERARVNVTRAIRTALKRIANYNPGLGRSLDNAIKTGTFSVYKPAPGEELLWDLSGPS
jgi:non-specific serine/threonine protein kinase